MLEWLLIAAAVIVGEQFFYIQPPKGHNPPAFPTKAACVAEAKTYFPKFSASVQTFCVSRKRPLKGDEHGV